MKRIVTLFLALSLALTGCSKKNFIPPSHDARTVELMLTMGLDKGEKGRVKMTVSGGSAQEGETKKEPVILSGQGETLAQALLQIQTQSDYYVSYGHVDGCLVGEDTAKEGVEALLDFVERDTEMRLNTYFYVVKGGTAEDLMRRSNSEEGSIPDRLEAMELDASLLSDGYSYTVKDFLVQMEDNGCALAPAIRMGEKEAESCGYACFQEDQLIGWFEKEVSRGVNLLENHMSGGTVTGTLPDGSAVSIRLEGAKCRWEPEFQGDRLVKLTAKIHTGGALEEFQGEADLSREQVWQEMDRLLRDTLTGEAQTVLDQCQQWNADLLHLESQAELAAPARHRQIAECWDSWFPDLELAVEIDCSVDRTYDIAQTVKGEAI